MGTLRYLIVVFALIPPSQIACSGPGHSRTYPESIERLWEAPSHNCEARPDDQIVCPRATFLKFLNDSVDLWELANLCLVDLDSVRKIKAVDIQELTGKLKNTELERDAARRQRWTWAGGAAIVAAIVTAVVAAAVTR